MPTYVVTDPSTGKRIRLTGDSPPSEQELIEIFAQFQQPKTPTVVDEDVPTESNLQAEQQRVAERALERGDRSALDYIRGLAEAGATTLTGATTGALGFGLGSIEGALKELTGEFESGSGEAERLAAQRGSQLTFEPQTEVGQEFVGEIGEALGALPPYMGLAPLSGLRASATANTNNARSALERARNKIDNPEETTNVQVVEAIKKGSEEDILNIAKVDPNFYRAADELGINTEPLAAFASQNPQFRDVSGALQSVPGSVLDVQARDFISEVSRRADTLIEEYGGSIDKNQLGQDFKRDSLNTIDNLFNEADKVYSDLKTVLPPTTRVEAPNTLDFISMKAMEFGGFEELPPRLKGIFNSLNPKTKGDTTTPPTLGRVDQIRKEIGQAIGKGTGPFKDVEQGLNKALYAKLSRDLDEFAESTGGDALAISNAGKALVKQRKQLEDNMVTLLGKDLNQALNVTVSGAIKNLSKGQTDRFREVLRAIPRAKRQEVVMTAMNDVFKGTGVGQDSLSPTQFTKWYQTINRSPSTKKLLFSSLPKESRKAIDNLFELSRGISRAQGQKKDTGRINALFNEDTGMIRKLVGRVAAPLVVTATGSPTASMSTSALMDFLNQTTNGAKVASDMVGSPAFQDMMRRAVRDGFIEGKQLTNELAAAEKRLMKTKQYKNWIDSMADKGVVLGTGGILSYLFNEEEQE